MIYDDFYVTTPICQRMIDVLICRRHAPRMARCYALLLVCYAPCRRHIDVAAAMPCASATQMLAGARC